MRNTHKYTQIYSGGVPQFIEGDTFRIIIPLSEVATATVGPISSRSSVEEISGEINGDISGEINGEIKLNATEQRVLAEIKKNPHITRAELMGTLGIGKGTLDRTFSRLKKVNLLERVGSNKSGHWKVL